MKNIYRGLVIIVIILTAVLAGLLIGQAGCRTNADIQTPKPAAISECIITTPKTNTGRELASTSEPFNTEGSYTDIPLSRTMGTREDVFARLEQFKQLPEEAKLILLDVGHGGFDGGAKGSFMSASEAELNLSVARYLSDELADMGYYVLMTRMGDYALASSKDADMEKRAEMLRLDIFDMCISIHMDSFPQDRKVCGARVYHKQTGDEGERLAELIMQKISAMPNQPSRPTIPGRNFMVIREPVAPAVLVECGFISNKAEEEKLNNPEYQKQMAEAVAQGIRDFFNGKPNP